MDTWAERVVRCVAWPRCQSFLMVACLIVLFHGRATHPDPACLIDLRAIDA